MLPLNAFTDFAEQNRLFNRETKIIAAVSGGMDSVLMAHLLQEGGYQFAIAHCNFNLRGEESVRDRAFCHLLAQSLGVPYFCTEFNTTAYAEQHRISIQMAARDLRYQWFEQLRQENGYDVIALAHHQNDTIETILLNLTRGTGIAGLHGIQPRNGYLVRPMLAFTREQIAEVVEKNNIDYVEDSSNASNKYARNKIRLEVVPKLKELNPNLEQTFRDHLQHFDELGQLLELQVEKLRQELLVYRKGEVHITIDKINELNPRYLLLSELLKPYGFNKTTIDDLLEALDKHPGRRFESPQWLAVVDREKLIISPLDLHNQTGITINENDESISFGRYSFSITHTSAPYPIPTLSEMAAIDAGKLIWPLTLRTWEQGDVFYPLGMETRKKLSDFFVDQKVPLTAKSRIPILMNGNGEIIWVAGYRLDNRYKITPGTEKISIFELSET